LKDKRLIGIDLGTTSIKVDSCDLDGNLLGCGRARIEGQTTEKWIEALVKASPASILRDYPSESKIVSVVGSSGTILLVDEFGNPVFSPIMYYTKAPEEASELKEYSSAKELAERGVETSPMSPLPKIVQKMRSEESRFKKVRWIVSPSSWLTYSLFFGEGEKWENLATDYTNAFKLGVDVTREKPVWFTSIFEDARVPVDLLPTLVPCGSHVGLAKSKLARKLGLENARLHHGMTDGNASALALGCLRKGDIGVGCGTTTFIKFVCETPKRHPTIYYHKHPLYGFLGTAAGPMTGKMLEWFSEKVLGISLETAFSYAERIEPGKETFYFPPGDRSPFYDPVMGATFAGLWPEDRSKGEVRGEIFRSMLLGTAFLEYYYIKLYEELFEVVNEVKIIGGGTKSSFWNKIRASIYEKTVKVMDERTTICALMPAALELRLFKNVGEAAERLLRVTDVVKPDAELASKYRDWRDSFMVRWKKIREVHGTSQSKGGQKS